MGGRQRWVIRTIIVAGLLISIAAALVATRYYPAYRSALAARDDLREAQARERMLETEIRRAEKSVADGRCESPVFFFCRARF